MDTGTNDFHLQNFLNKNIFMLSLVHFLFKDAQFSLLHFNTFSMTKVKVEDKDGMPYYKTIVYPSASTSKLLLSI